MLTIYFDDFKPVTDERTFIWQTMRQKYRETIRNRDAVAKLRALQLSNIPDSEEELVLKTVGKEFHNNSNVN